MPITKAPSSPVILAATCPLQHDRRSDLECHQRLSLPQHAAVSILLWPVSPHLELLKMLAASLKYILRNEGRNFVYRGQLSEVSHSLQPNQVRRLWVSFSRTYSTGSLSFLTKSSKVTYHFAFLPAMWVPISIHPCQNEVLSVLWILAIPKGM